MTRRRETLDEFTERAIRATDAGKLIPPIVYLPKRLRGHQTRLTVDHVKLTLEPPTVKENHLRILDADPLGFLMAMMHGQPIPAFHITPEGAIEVRYEVPNMDVRERVAKFLAHKVTIRGKTDNRRSDLDNDDDWDDIVDRREQGVRDAADHS